jgi:hypothetical protein
MGLVVVLLGAWKTPQLGAWPNDRLRLLGSHTIRVGQAALLLPILGIPYFSRSPNTMVRLAVLALIPVALIVSAASGSRGPLGMAIITALLAGIYVAVTRLSSRYRRGPLISPSRVLLGLALIAIGAMAVMWAARSGYLPEASVERVLSLQEAAGSFTGSAEDATDASVEGRVKSYDQALAMFNSAPLIGHGTASFPVLAAQADSDMRGFEYPHNLFLQAGAEFGVLGILLIGALVVAAIRRGLRLTGDRAWRAVLTLAVFLVLGALVSNGIVDNRTMWGPLVLLLAAPLPAMARQTAPAPSPREIPRRHATAGAAVS